MHWRCSRHRSRPGEPGPVSMLAGETGLTCAGQLSALIIGQRSGGTRHLTTDVSGSSFADSAPTRAAAAVQQLSAFPQAQAGAYPGGSSSLRFCCLHKRIIARRRRYANACTGFRPVSVRAMAVRIRALLRLVPDRANVACSSVAGSTLSIAVTSGWFIGRGPGSAQRAPSGRSRRCAARRTVRSA